MWATIIQLVIAAIQAGVDAEQKSEADKAMVAAQAQAALATLKGIASQVKSDHDARTAETIKEIDDAEAKAKP